MFKNIDGVTSNFDLFSTKLMLKNEELSVLTLAETNLDECNKNIFKLQGFESIYQSKRVGKHKGSGFAIYIKEAFLFTKLDAFSQCSSNLESLFISINNTENPITVGVFDIRCIPLFVREAHVHRRRKIGVYNDEISYLKVYQNMRTYYPI